MSAFYNEIIAAIEENEGKTVQVPSWDGKNTYDVDAESASSLLYEDDEGAVSHALAQFQGITATVVEHEGGMDEGSTYFTVWKFTRGDDVCYIRFDGWYASHVGSEYESCWEVAPEQKTITVYNAV